MKLLPALILAAVASLARAADLPQFATLRLKTGREYEKVTVTEKRPDGISISHDSGTARIKFEDLPEDVARQLGGFDPATAAQARAATDAAEAAARAEIDSTLAGQGDEQRAADHRKAIVDASVAAALHIVQMTDGGALCRLAFAEDHKSGTTSKDAFGRDVVTYHTSKQLTHFSRQLHFVEGVRGAVDGDEVAAAIVGAGSYTYTTTDGAEATVRKWRVVHIPQPK